MELPNEFRSALAMVQGFHPRAFIGGGALRDLMLDRPVKDIDIFVQATGHQDLHDYLLAKGYRRTAFASSQYLGGDLECVRASEYALGFGIPINVVELLSFVSLPGALDRHDFGLCQIGFDGNTLMKSAAFERDVANKTLTLIRCESSIQFNRSMRRAERLRQKYPEHQLVVPDEFMAFSCPSDPLDPF